MKTYLFSFLGIFLLCSSCVEGDGDRLTTCDTNPAENVDWIRELIAQQNASDCDDCSLEIIQYAYQGGTVFSVDNCIDCSDALINVFDCQKDLVCEFGGIVGLNTCPDFEARAVEEAVVYTTRIMEEEVDGCEKSVIINNEVYNAFSATPIQEISIEGNCMLVTFSLLSTQDPLEDVVLVDSGLVLESFPIQRSLKLYVKESLTKPSVVQATVSFDIADLSTWNAPEAILNIEGYAEQVNFVRIPQCGDPNVTCLAPTQEQDFKELGFMLDELKVISSIVTCETDEDILLTPVGSKACGGPQLFLPYTTSINVEDFLSKVAIYTEAEDFYNKKWSIISTCEITSPPKVACENGKPVLSISNTL